VAVEAKINELTAWKVAPPSE